MPRDLSGKMSDDASNHYLAGEYDAAEAMLREAIAIAPDLAEAHANLGVLLLTKGEYKQGFREFEWRWKLPAFVQDTPKKLRGDFWDGRHGEKSASLFVHAEQGYGDTIHMARYAIAAQQTGMQVTLSVQPELLRLLETLPVHHVQATHHPIPDFDYHCPLMSMPLAMEGLIGYTIPFAHGYIPSLPALTQRWRTKLDAAGFGVGPNIGIAWKGNPAFAMDRNRSVFLAEIMHARGLPEGRYFSLQKGGSEEAEVHGLIDWTAECVDFADTAALIANMDMVITTDTAVAHLAGAMNKPTHIVLPAVPDWRWGLSGHKSVWYSSVTLHRREKR